MENVTQIDQQLEKARLDLLDLTTRNRLLSTSRTSRSGRLDIVAERSEELFRILVTEGKSMTFLSRPDGEEDPETDDGGVSLALFEPEERDDDAYTDLQLQTRLSADALQKRLLRLYYDARTFEEEQGVNILFLTLGFLRWFEDGKSDRERFAPLVLLPVALDRRSANSKFRLSYTDDDIITNLSLQEKLRVDFGVTLPDIPSDLDGFSPTEYFKQVRTAIAEKERWEVVDDDVVLWFFSFSKFLMYRDLQPDTWPEGREIGQHALVSSLLHEGFRGEPPICGEDENIDGILDPLDMVHIMDADSSQSVVIEEARTGRNLVVQGPPGTGKSQTIANLIAAAVKDGKSVLFVAEKMAALEVVKRRLDSVGLGDMCLELHSHKSNKRAVVQELGRTLGLQRPSMDGVELQAEELKTSRDRLNRHAVVLHTYLEPAQLTPYQVVGELVRLRASGVPPASFQLEDPLVWSPQDLRERQGVLEDLVIHLGELGPPREHCWRGVMLHAALPSDLDRLVARLSALLPRMEALQQAGVQLAELLQYDYRQTFKDCSKVAQFGQWIGKTPPMDRTVAANSVWQSGRDEIEAIVEAGTSFANHESQLKPIVADVAWDTSVDEARRHLAAFGRSWFRWFNGRYRSAQATLAGILQERPPSALDDRIAILDGLMKSQKARRHLESESADLLGRSAFGTGWQGVTTDWSGLKEILEWDRGCREANLPAHFREIVQSTGNLEAFSELVGRIAEHLKPAFKELEGIVGSLQLDVEKAFGTADLRHVPLPLIIERIREWLDDAESITKWIAFQLRWRKLAPLGMGDLAEQIEAGSLSTDEVVDQFQMAYFEDVIRDAFHRFPELAEFDGLSHEQRLARFKELDLQRLEMARQEVAAAHFSRLPSHNGEVGEVGVLKRELKKKRNHIALRSLLQKAGHAVQAIKPVFMMSPVSIAQFLQPGVLEFDLLFIDEASQVRPVDALGGIGRARQMVVVGDDKQLPPTRFFGKLAGDETEETESDDIQASDLESILGLCEAQNMPQRMLQWHYRSRHQSLIAVSNREFYDSRLFVVPSPFTDSPDLGLHFQFVSDGTFDRGASRTNRGEARVVAQAVQRHARQCPQKSLGIGAFSVAQRDAILDEIELLRRDDADLEAFIAQSTTEPFFVKNLENIQGDERDVILISVGYGKDPSGHMTMNFGPLNSEGGERRLNVLISRSKERCVVFTSIQPDDIDLKRTQSRGARALKTFLTFARDGILDGAAESVGDVESEFERQVAIAVAQLGFQVDSQIGVAGFRVDLGVVDPDKPGRYILGIECDGATYHSSRSARDRDRIRQQILEDRGWVIHRIWSTDWFHRPDEQLRKVAEAIEAARATWAGRDMGLLKKAETATEPTVIVREEAEDLEITEERSAVESIPYEEASFTVHVDREIHELMPKELARVVTRIVQTEGPIHLDEIARRTAGIWGKNRIGTRIVGAVEAALDWATHQGDIESAGAFFDVPDRDSVPIRNREGVQSGGLRKAECLPPAEIQSAVVAVVSEHHGATSSEAVAEVARLFGLKRTGPAIRTVIEEEIAFMLQQSILSEQDGRLQVDDGGRVTLRIG